MRLGHPDRAFGCLVAIAALVGAGAWTVLCCGAWALGTAAVSHGPATLVTPRLLPALALVAFLAVALARVGASLTRQILATLRLSRTLERYSAAVPRRVAEVATRVGSGARVQYVEVDEPFSCTYGPLRPTVAVSRGLVQITTDDELAAVLAHEAYHVRAGDPAKVVVARALRAGLFVIPVLGGLLERYLVARELAADRGVVRVMGTSGLAGALLKATGRPDDLDVGAAAALGGEPALELRVAQLETGGAPAPSPLGRPSLYTSVAVAAGLGTLMGSAGVGLAPAVARLCNCG